MDHNLTSFVWGFRILQKSTLIGLSRHQMLFLDPSTSKLLIGKNRLQLPDN